MAMRTGRQEPVILGTRTPIMVLTEDEALEFEWARLFLEMARSKAVLDSAWGRFEEMTGRKMGPTERLDPDGTIWRDRLEAIGRTATNRIHGSDANW